MRSLGVCCLLLSSVLSAAAQQAPRAGDRAAIDACLQSEKGAPARCIGIVYRTCIAAPQGRSDQTPPESTVRRGMCAQRETLVWREKMDLSLKALRAGPLGQTLVQPWNRPPENKLVRPMPGRALIDDMQVSWQAWRAKKCDIVAMRYEGGSLSRLLYGECIYEETARHALWLRRQVEDNAPK